MPNTIPPAPDAQPPNTPDQVPAVGADAVQAKRQTFFEWFKACFNEREPVPTKEQMETQGWTEEEKKVVGMIRGMRGQKDTRRYLMEQDIIDTTFFSVEEDNVEDKRLVSLEKQLLHCSKEIMALFNFEKFDSEPAKMHELVGEF